MQEELPQGDYHTQEERRLFYVALTRAEDRLTLTTVAERKAKFRCSLKISSWTRNQEARYPADCAESTDCSWRECNEGDE